MTALLGFTVRVTDERAIKQWAGDLPWRFADNAELIVRSAGLTAERVAKQLVPVRHNRLKASLRLQVDRTQTTITARVGTLIPYGPYVEYGTGLFGPYKRRIFPRTKKALSWIPETRGRYQAGRYIRGSRGNRITVRSIAGMKPRPYMAPAKEEGQKQLMADLERLADLGFPGKPL
jgi:hypothetical protein